ncbi:MAG: GDSL-type esterase/lipase family protein [Rhodospirillales bacterium]|nr:GDSL-type esterase/lipase family protein [Rhodospirillales bacterium]
MSSRVGHLKSIILVALISVVVLIAMLELILRFTRIGDSLVEGDFSLQPPRHLVVREWLPNTTFTFSPPQIRRDNPGGKVLDIYEIKTDRNGFIVPGRIHDDPDLTIAFVGGSTTECLYVQPQLRFPYLTGRILEQRHGIKVNTLNAGKSGNTTMHSSLQLIAKIIPEEPDIVVVMNNTNDGGVLGGQQTYWNQNTNYRIVKHVDRSVERGVRTVRDAIFPYAYRAIKRSIRKLRAIWQTAFTGFGVRTAHAEAPDHESTRRSVQRIGLSYQRAMTQFVRTALAWDIRPLVLTQPILNEGEWKPGNDARADYLGRARAKAELSFTDFKNRHDYFNGIAVWVAEKHGAGHLDLADSREWTSRELYDGLHFTDAGAQYVAQYVASAIAEMLDLAPANLPGS